MDSAGNKPPLVDSPQRLSSPSAAAVAAQLSSTERVESYVGSVAMDQVLLATGGVPMQTPAIAGAPLSADGLTDADVMLRVKEGDDSAFDYLVQKYRRPIVNFMARMARNSAVAEELAQEVFLRVYRSRGSY